MSNIYIYIYIYIYVYVNTYIGTTRALPMVTAVASKIHTHGGAINLARANRTNDIGVTGAIMFFTD